MGAPGSQPGPGGDRPRPAAQDPRRGRGCWAGAAARGPGRPPMPGSITGRTPGRPAAPRCFDCCIPQTSTSAPVTRISARRPRRSGSASSPRSCAAIDLALAEKVDLFLVAGDLFDSNVQPAPLGGAGGGRAPPAGPGPHPDGDHAGHARRLRPRVGLPRLRPAAIAGTRPAERDGHGPDAGAPVDPPPGARHRRPWPVLPDQARAAQPAARPGGGQDARRDLAARRPPRLGRDPRPHRRRRRRGHGRGDRRQRARLPRPWPLARRAGGPDQRRHLRLRRRARSPSRSTRTRRARSCSSRSIPTRTASTRSRSRSARSGRTTFERREIDAATVESQPALVAAPDEGARTRTSSSTCG